MRTLVSRTSFKPRCLHRQVPSGSLVRQAVHNLLANALKYSQGVVHLAAARPGGVVLTVRDEGPGVPDAMLHEITKPFFRLGGRAGGSGLGLALVKHIAHTLGGRLELRNRERGLEVRLELPSLEPTEAR